MTQGAAFDAAVAKLEAAGLDDPKGEARRLYGLAFPRRYTDFGEDQNAATLARFEDYVARRASREPFSHIAGHRLFWKYKFSVTPDVLDPRPDTETLVELALSQPFHRVLDLGTGSGCIVISLLADREDAFGIGTDLSERALDVARQNAAEVERVNGPDVTKRLTLIPSDWFEKVEGSFDLIVSNPPYIAKGEMDALEPEVRDHEPRMALTDENDGLEAYRAIAKGAGTYLAENGRILVEIGPTQAEAVCALFQASGLCEIAVHKDLDGRDRVVAARNSA